jgi:predicted DNA helicase
MAGNRYSKIKTLSRNPETNSYVYHIKDTETGDELVLKQILGLDNSLHRAIFDKELQALTKLRNSDNIVRLLGYEHGKNKKGIFEGRIYLEYIEGDTLEKLCSMITSVSDKFNIIKSLIGAIELSHEYSIIHRDINPKNIMLTSDLLVKVIDFGICKIKDMVGHGTTYQFATNKYAAPEVRYHSENATVQSDIYSLGAVFYYLFTKNEPPNPDDFQDTIQFASGIDPQMKDIILKMTRLAANDRYESLVDVASELAPLYRKYLKSDEKYYISVSTTKLNYLKRKNLVPGLKSFDQLIKEDLVSNFSDAHVYTKTLDDDTIYCFDGNHFSMNCLYDSNSGIFLVDEFQNLPLYIRNKNKKTAMYVSGDIRFIASSTNVYEENNGFQLINRMDDHLALIKSKKNIDIEFSNNYGFWYEFLKIMEEDAISKVPKFYYSKFEMKDNLYYFHLTEDSFMSNEGLTLNTELIFEQPKPNKPNEYKIVLLGTFVRYSGDGSILVIKPSSKRKKPPKSGSLSINYQKEISQYRRQKHALDEFVHEEYGSMSNLKSILVGIEEPTFIYSPTNIKFFNKNLDDTQKLAVKIILESRDIALIQGPPGTGKTNVIIEVIRQIIRHNKLNSHLPQNILLVSQSHAAVDKILEDLDPFLIETKVVRIGTDDNLTDLVRDKYGIDNQKNAWIQEIITKSSENLNRSLKKLNIDDKDFIAYSNAMDYLALTDTSEEVLRQSNTLIEGFLEKYRAHSFLDILNILLLQMAWINEVAETGNIEEYFIKASTIVAGTCSGFSSNQFLNGTLFDYVIVDEAAKATLPEILIPLVRAKKVILVGDHKQLPPVFDDEAISSSTRRIDKSDLKRGGFEKIFDILPEKSKLILTTQYRMHPIIGDMIGSVFYDNGVQNGISIADRENLLPSYNHTAMMWISTSKSDKRKERPFTNENGKKTFLNKLEASIVAKEVARLDKEIGTRGYTVAVITPYSAQIITIRRELQKLELRNITVDVNTVDAFQGSQKDIIIYSTVRTDKIGFLKEKERINVSFSRASRLLIIVGDSEFLNNRSIDGNRFPDIIKYMRAHNDYCRFIDIKGDVI